MPGLSLKTSCAPTLCQKSHLEPFANRTSRQLCAKLLCCTILLGPLLPVNAAPACSADIDGDGQLNALTDGLLNLRYLFGLRGDALVKNVLGQKAIQTNPHNIANYLSSADCKQLFDIDHSMENGDNHPDALSDGVLFIRFLFGIRGQSLTNGTLNQRATITTSAAIASSIARIVEQMQISGTPDNTVIEFCVDNNPCFQDIEIEGEISSQSLNMLTE